MVAKERLLFLVLVALVSFSWGCSGGSSSGNDTTGNDVAGQDAVSGEVTTCELASDCDDDNPCTQDECTDGACIYANVTDSCDDGNPCTEADQCVAGECKGTEMNCDDGMYCNGPETCDPGGAGCMPGDAPEIDDGIGCTYDECDEDSKMVVHLPDSSLCEDGNLCTANVCDEVSGCTLVNLEGDACDDEDPCTSDDSCADGQCVGTEKDCNDGSWCNGEETCDSSTGDCLAGQAPVVDDGLECTIDTCSDELGQVVNTPDSSLCNDDNVCTEDVCDVLVGCTFVPTEGACDDGNDCTGNDVCVSGACEGGEDICVEICDNEQDDDGDELIDCEDDDCLEDPFCEGSLTGDSCADPLALNEGLALTAADEGALLEMAFDFKDMTDTVGSSCNELPSFGIDLVYQVTLEETLGLTISAMFTTAGGPDIFILGDDCATEVSCTEGTVDGTSQLTEVLPAGTYFIYIDSGDASGEESGDFTVEVFLPVVTETLCDNQIDDDGDGAADCEDEDCKDDPACVQVPGETCLDAIPLVEGGVVSLGDQGLTVTLSGDTSGMNDDLSAPCDEDTNGSADLVYTVTLTDPMNVTASFDFEDMNYPALYLFEGTCEEADLMGCVTAGTEAAVLQGSVPAGEYFLVLDASWPGDEGPYSLTVTFEAVPETELDCANLTDDDLDGDVDCDDEDCAQSYDCIGYPGDTCDDPILFNNGTGLTLADVGTVFTIEGSTEPLSDDLEGSCEGATAGSNDVVYKVIVDEAMILKLSHDFDEYNYPAIYVFDGLCDQGETLGCATATTDAAALELELEPGTYFVVLDASWTGDAGTYTFTVEPKLPLGVETDCSDGLDNDGDGLTDCCDDDCSEDGACQAEALCGDGLDNDCDGVADCCDADCAEDAGCLAELVCTDGEDNDCDGVADCCDSDCGQDGACQAEALCGDELDNDCDELVDCLDSDCFSAEECLGETCESAIALNDGQAISEADDGLQLVVTGDTSTSQPLMAGSCHEDMAYASDLVYTFTLTETMLLDAEMDFEDSGNWPGMYLFQGSCVADQEVVCVGEDSSDAASFIGQVLVAGTYYLVADATYSSDEGPFTITLQFTAPEPSEVNCGDGIDNDGDNLKDCCDDDCAGDQLCAGEALCGDGKDNDCDGVVDCCDSDCAADAACTAEALCGDGDDNDCDGFIDCCDSDCQASETSCQSEGLCGDGEDNDCDNMVDCEDADCSQGLFCNGGSCEHPLFLNDGESIGAGNDGLQLVVTGDTTGAGVNHAGSCKTSTGGAEDLVYTFTLTETMDLTISHDFDGDNNLWPAFYIYLNSCEEAQEVVCRAESSSQALSADLRLEAGQYFLVIDAAYYSDKGPFTTTLDFSVPIYNETNCSDNVDEDGDELTDCCDEDCAEDPACGAETLCGDELDNDCDGVMDCEDEDCYPDQICLGASCASPIVLNNGAAVTLDDDGLQLTGTGNTVGKASGFTGSCDSYTAAASDLVFQFTLADEMLVSLSLDFDGQNNLWPALYLLGAACTSESELACDAPGDSSAAIINELLLAPGTYFVVADAAYSTDQGPFTLVLDFAKLVVIETECSDGLDNDGDNLIDCCDSDCAADSYCLAETLCGDMADNDCDQTVDCEDSDCFSAEVCQGVTCALAIVLNGGTGIGTADDGLQLVAQGTTVGAGDNYAGSCSQGSQAANDLAYTFTLVEAMEVTLAHDFTDNALWPAVYLFTSQCEVGAEAGCAVGEAQAATLTQVLEPGTYYVVVDADQAAQQGAFTLTLDFALPPITVETNCTDGVDEDEDNLVDCCDSDCAQVEACLSEALCGDGLDNDCDGVADCCDEDCGQEEACQSERVCDDEFDNDCDGILDCEDPDCAHDEYCDGEICASAFDLLSGGTVTAEQLPVSAQFNGSTTGSRNDLGAGCGEGTYSAPEQVYFLTLETSGVMSLSLDFAGDVFPALYIYKDLCGDGQELACATATTGAAEIIDLLVSPGTYYIVIDGAYAGDEGDFVLSVSMTQSELVEDNCRNGVDDDQDGAVDCEDSNCSEDPNCQLYTLPYLEDFEHGGELPPQGYILGSDAECSWDVASGGSDGSDWGVQITYGACSTTSPYWITTGFIDVSQCDTISLIYDEYGQYVADTMVHGIALFTSVTEFTPDFLDPLTSDNQWYYSGPVDFDVSGVSEVAVGFGYLGEAADLWRIDNIYIECSQESARCGDETCDSNETCETCSIDCGECTCADYCLGLNCGDGGVEGCFCGTCDSGYQCNEEFLCEAIPGFAPSADDLVITEIMQNPSVLNDQGEWFEVRNISQNILQLEGLVISDLGSDEHTVIGSLIVNPGDYLVFGNNSDPLTNGGVTLDYQYQGFTLSNSDDEVVLTFDGVIIDQVAYDGGTEWPDPDGASMQLEPAAIIQDNNVGSAWCVSFMPYGDGDFGTPGAANDSCFESTCSDQLDNDGDTYFDCDDTDCQGIDGCGELICDDDISNDGDNMVDCEDDDCAGTTVCGDDDGDGIWNKDDLCPLGDDNIDVDGDNAPDLCEITWAGDIWPNSGTSFDTGENVDIYVQVYKAGLTDSEGMGAGVEVRITYSNSSASEPTVGLATYHGDAGSTGGNDEYKLTVPSSYTIAGDSLVVGVSVSYDAGVTKWTYNNFSITDQSGNPVPMVYEITGDVPAAANLFFSEYIEGSGTNNKAIEIYNAGSAPYNLSQCVLGLYVNGADEGSETTLILGDVELAAGEVYVICHVGIADNSNCDLEDNFINHNGDDAFKLTCGGQIQDVFGQIHFDPGTAWVDQTGTVSSKDMTLTRKCGVDHGDVDGTVAFDPGPEWTAAPIDTFSGLGSHTAVCPL